jgi:AhpD family alkylhydroperoxidase
MALAVAFATQCPYCIEIHSGKARESGATDPEIAEVVAIAAALRAGAAIQGEPIPPQAGLSDHRHQGSLCQPRRGEQWRSQPGHARAILQYPTGHHNERWYARGRRPCGLFAGHWPESCAARRCDYAVRRRVRPRYTPLGNGSTGWGFTAVRHDSQSCCRHRRSQCYGAVRRLEPVAPWVCISSMSWFPMVWESETCPL